MSSLKANNIHHSEDVVGYAYYASIDYSYIEFLDHQISVNAGGEKWTKILIQRKNALESFIGVVILIGQININDSITQYYFDITVRLIHQEQII